MSTSKETNGPATIVLVPGLCHPHSVFDELISCLRKAGYSTAVTSNPSCDPRDPSITDCAADTKVLRENVLLPLIEEQGKDVLVFAHSYGGIPGGGAAAGLSKTTRLKEGKTGGVIGLVYLAAGVVKEGDTVLNTLGGEYIDLSFIKLDKPSTGLFIVENAVEKLMLRIPETIAAKVNAILRPHSRLSLEAPAPAPAWVETAFAGRLCYIRCGTDCSLPLLIQNMYIEKSEVEWIVKDVDACHNAFLSDPEGVAQLTIGLTEIFQAKEL